ncbi:hypothetical protein MASR2M78_05020 [Treponema sp.]
MTLLSSLQPLDLPEPGSTVAVALSGGVDSSLVASLLSRRGCKVVGRTMRIYDPRANPLSPSGKGCYGPFEEENEQACRRLCDSLGAEYYVFDLAEAYGTEILGNFKAEYRAGRTPNPCLRCNPLLKFGLLPGKLKESGVHFDYYATGHYVQLLLPEGDVKKGVYLAPARDAGKDQSYFLQRLSYKALESCPLSLWGSS